MRKSVSLTIILFLACLFFSKCEKDNDYPRKFIFDSYSAGPLKLFTNSGEVTDQEKINRIISGFENDFWLNTDSLSTDDWNLQIELLSETRARMILNSDSITDFITTRKKGVLYFEYLDTLITNCNLVNEILMYHPLYMVSVSSFPGMHTTAFVPCIYAIENEDQLYIPMVSYMENIYYDNGSLMASQAIGNHNNEFNTGYINSLSLMPLTDTILYQNNKVIFSSF
jgi:hypothetical protein